MLFYKFNGQASKTTQNRKHHNTYKTKKFQQTKHTLLIRISNLLTETPPTILKSLRMVKED